MAGLGYYAPSHDLGQRACARAGGQWTHHGPSGPSQGSWTCEGVSAMDFARAQNEMQQGEMEVQQAGQTRRLLVEGGLTVVLAAAGAIVGGLAFRDVKGAAGCAALGGAVGEGWAAHQRLQEGVKATPRILGAAASAGLGGYLLWTRK